MENEGNNDIIIMLVNTPLSLAAKSERSFFIAKDLAEKVDKKRKWKEVGVKINLQCFPSPKNFWTHR